MQDIPSIGFLRLSQIVNIPARKGGGKNKERPATKGIIPISGSSWWTGIAEGRYPKPIKLSARTTVWKVEDIRRLIDSAGETP